MRIIAGDTYAMAQQLLWDDNNPFDLTAAESVTMVMYADGSTTQSTIIGTCIIDPDPAKRAEGFVVYPWADGETDTPGVYWLTFQVTMNDGQVITVPNMRPIMLVILSPSTINAIPVGP